MELAYLLAVPLGIIVAGVIYGLVFRLIKTDVNTDE